MAQDLTTRTVAAIPAIDTADPASMLLLPDWLASQLAAVSDLGAGRTEVDSVSRQITARVATIPISKMPTGPQRVAIMGRITELLAAAEPGPTKETIAALGDLIQEYAPARLDDRTVSIKAEAYLDAVEDLPAWAVRAAIRRWRRGEVDADPATLDFAPRPARLRGIAERLLLVARGQAARLQRILDAKPEEPISAEQMQRNGERLARIAQRASEGPAADSASQPTGSASAEKRAALADLERRRETAGQAQDQPEAAADAEDAA